MWRDVCSVQRSSGRSMGSCDGAGSFHFVQVPHGTIHGPHDMRVGLLEHRAGLGDLHNEAAMN